MKTGIYYLIILLLSTTGLQSEKWYSYEDGRLLSAQKKKQLIVYFYRENCPYCRQMETFVLSDAEVESVIRKYYIFATVDLETEEGEKTGSGYGISASPSFVILDTNMKTRHVITGSLTKENFIRRLQDYSNANMKNENFGGKN